MRKKSTAKQLLLLLFVLALAFFSETLSAQNQNQIRGTVNDELTGSPLPNVSVVIKGTTKGTVTNQAGDYNINAANGDVQVNAML